jgi:hypothetical protein
MAAGVLNSQTPAKDSRSAAVVSVSSGFDNAVGGSAPRRYNQNEILAPTRPPVGDEGRFGGNAAFTAMAAWNTTNAATDNALDIASTANWMR